MPDIGRDIETIMAQIRAAIEGPPKPAAPDLSVKSLVIKDDPHTRALLQAVPKLAVPDTLKATAPLGSPISQAAIDLIVMEEVSSRAVYVSRYQRPEWPQGSSGVTIGIGYDLGYSTRQQIADDWSKLVTPAMLSAMQRCAGVHGTNARDLLPSVRGEILIPWDAAMSVFMGRDVPKWTQTCRDHLPHFEELHPDAKGALVSLAYNRGPSFDMEGDRYTEMRAIKAHMLARAFDQVPGDIRSMKRIWPTQPGLRRRREDEAELFEKGLRA